MSIRLRLALIYSLVLCLLAALAVGAIYLALAHAIDSSPVYSRSVPVATPDGIVVQRETFKTVERVVNEATLEKLRNYSLSALLILFVASVGVGWAVAGYVLRPIGRITGVAREISATDLSRRIDLPGPDDELHQLADTFDQMLARLDAAFDGQRQFIQDASHELRNPLAVIRTNLEVTLSDPDATAEDLRRTAEVVQRSTERMTRLVDDLLVYARNETPVLERQAVDAAALVPEAAEEFRASAEARNLRIETSAAPGLWVAGDRNALRQALANLLANATRLAPEGSTVTIRAGREGPWVWLAVDDQGPGIAASDQDRVFERFWRGQPARPGEDRRSGLGLTIVRQIALAHGGEVKLVSAPAVGSTFAIWLPALAEPGAPSAAGTAVVPVLETVGDQPDPGPASRPDERAGEPSSGDSEA